MYLFLGYYNNLPALPTRFRILHIDRYDGSKDPGDHIAAYRAHMTLLGTPNKIICKAFPLTVKGLAIKWFTNLRLKSIEILA